MVDQKISQDGKPLSGGEVHYLAYGSNLHPGRLLARVASARVVGLVELQGRRLGFAKRGRDGSGKCMFDPGAAEAVMFGVLYALDAADKAELDRIEGLGRGYDEERLFVAAHGSDGVLRTHAYTYAASPMHVDRALRPFDWYRSLVLAGALYHGFPSEYVVQIESVESVPDPDSERAAEHRRLLREIGYL